MTPVPPLHRRLRAAVTTLLCLLLLPALLVGTATGAVAAPGQSIDYRDPSDSEDRTCTDVVADGSTHAVLDSNTTGSGSVGSVHYSESWDGEPDVSITIDGRYASPSEAVSIGYAVPPVDAGWTLQERVTGGGTTGYQYLRYVDAGSTRFLYHLQITRPGSTTPEYASYDSGTMTAHQRERVIGFHDNVVAMRAQHDQLTVGAAAGVALFGLGVGALFTEGASFSATAVACAAVVVTGGAALAAVWIRFLQARRNAAAGFDEAAVP